MRIALNSAGRLAAFCAGGVILLSLAGWGLQPRAEESFREEIRRRAEEMVPAEAAVSPWLRLPEGLDGTDWEAEPRAVEYRELSPARVQGGERLIIFQGEGYGGALWAAVMYGEQGTPGAFRVLFHRESPGYGPAPGDLLGPAAGTPGEALDAVAGATVTRQALVRILEKGSRIARELGRQTNG